MLSEKLPSILVVDDNKKNLHADKRILQELNINIKTANSGEEALKLIVNHDFFLILMDVEMPGMNGFETVSMIRGNDNYKHIPVIFLTASSKDEKHMEAGYDEGAVDFVFKPIDPIFLLSKINVFLELKLQQNNLKIQASSDALTGLANRHMFQEFETKTFNRAKRNSTSFAVIFIDLDLFKDVNDSLGHAAGDYLLQSVANRITDCVRSEDMAARLGGDEFAVILTEITHQQDAGIVANNILQSLMQPHIFNGNEITSGASIGIACYPKDGDSCEALNKAADTAMYSAKKHRNSVQFFTEEMQNKLLDEIALSRDLTVALDEQSLQVYYQPIVDAKTGKTTGLEALVRWQHPERGMIDPELIISLAEASGQMIRLGSWVLETAASQCAHWYKNKSDLKVSISINASMTQLNKAGFVESVDKILQQTTLPPELLELEFSESSLMEDAKIAIETIASLRTLGVKIAMDHFGTGSLNLSQLCNLAVDMIKIDLSIIQSIGDVKGCPSLVKAIINLAHTLGIKVVAGGVETEQQIKFLTEQGCDFMQGFYYGKAKPVSELDEFCGEI